MVGHIFIEREIGFDTTPDVVRNQINAYPDASEFEVHFNSFGGDVYDGYQIGVMISSLPVPTVALIEGQCASIATYIAMCCGKRVMYSSGDWTIHDPTGTMSGGAKDFRQAADRLDRIKAEIINCYLNAVRKKGVTAEQLDAMMSNETSMSPDDALNYGFIDEVVQKLKAVAKLDNLKKFLEMEKTDKDVQKTFFDTLEKKFNDFFKKFAPKNEVAITLADGTQVTSDAADPNAIVDSTIMDASGTPLPDGEYETQDGFELVIAGGVVTEYDPLQDAMSAELAALKQQLAQAQAQNKALEGQVAEAKKASGVTAQMQAEFKNLQKELNELKTNTFGNPNPPDPGSFRDRGGEELVNDPMSELGDAFLSTRGAGWVQVMGERQQIMASMKEETPKKKRKVRVIEVDDDDE